MQQIQLFTDSVVEFLYTADTALLMASKNHNKVNFSLQLIPILACIVKILSVLFAIGLSFVISLTLRTGLNYYKRLSDNNPHLTFQQKSYYM